MKYIIDIDKTILEVEGSDYYEAIPIVKRISKINALLDAGHTIIYYTGRGSNSGINWNTYTKNQLAIFGARYTELWMNKPAYDIWIDDKAIHADDFF